VHLLLVILVVPLWADAQRGATLPKAVTAACDPVHAAIAKTPGIKERRRSGSFDDDALRAAVASCRIDIDGSMKQLGREKRPTDRLAEYFEAPKGDQRLECSSDGHDGTSFAYQKSGAACLVRGLWDGGSDDEPDAPTADPCTMVVLCGNAADFVRPQ
jgi:hypothetical protein